MALTKEQLGEKMRDPRVLILNILPRREFLEMHIPGSENVPMTSEPEDFFRTVVEKFGKDRFFILHGMRFGLLDSFLGTQALQDRGLKAANYPGGIQEWHRAGLPVEGTGPAPSRREFA